MQASILAVLSTVLEHEPQNLGKSGGHQHAGLAVQLPLPPEVVWLNRSKAQSLCRSNVKLVPVAAGKSCNVSNLRMCAAHEDAPMGTKARTLGSPSTLSWRQHRQGSTNSLDPAQPPRRHLGTTVAKRLVKARAKLRITVGVLLSTAAAL